MKKEHTKIALIGGGPAAMFMYKEIIAQNSAVHVTIFERSERLGAGMPYSKCGAEAEHVTNVSANEIPELPQTPMEWWEARNADIADSTTNYSPYKVFPRRIFGDYLESQFNILISNGREKGIKTDICTGTMVNDINYLGRSVIVSVEGSKSYLFDKVVICTGHRFPTDKDEAATGVYKSPYPPQKLSLQLNHAVAIKGASLTAVDAIKTLARANGAFSARKNDELVYKPDTDSPDFKIVLHCRSGMLPAVRFHLADPHLKNPSLLTEVKIEEHKRRNDGFLSLDYIFEKDFLEPLRQSSPDLYNKVKDMNMERFVDSMLEVRHRVDPFVMMRSECNEAAKSIRRKESVYWKEMLGVLSFAMNYPAKYFSAEDMLRFKATLHPLISLVIAYIPQSSCRELLALHKAGSLDLVNVGNDSSIEQRPGGGITYHYTDEAGKDLEINYNTFIDCTGQPHIDLSDFPFKGLANAGTVSQARLAFRSEEAALRYKADHPADVEIVAGTYYLNVSGVAVDDRFRIVDEEGRANDAIYMMAVPLMGGYNPDYSGLDFCEEASKRIAESLLKGKEHAVMQLSGRPVLRPMDSVA
ncbi:FAD/NAD(P)-binding protein [Flavobacterium sp.]|uniref:FAD/NAD(P)-binding protein n=1 Tax=Flavobacterium sp. TaxID=239 RepID=UPI0040333700